MSTWSSKHVPFAKLPENQPKPIYHAEFPFTQERMAKLEQHKHALSRSSVALSCQPDNKDRFVSTTKSSFADPESTSQLSLDDYLQAQQADKAYATHLKQDLSSQTFSLKRPAHLQTNYLITAQEAAFVAPQTECLLSQKQHLAQVHTDAISKNKSSHFVSEQDRKQTNYTSEYKQTFDGAQNNVPPQEMTVKEQMLAIKKDMRSCHFEMGSDTVDNTKTTVRDTYTKPKDAHLAIQERIVYVI